MGRMALRHRSLAPDLRRFRNYARLARGDFFFTAVRAAAEALFFLLAGFAAGVFTAADAFVVFLLARAFFASALAIESASQSFLLDVHRG